MNYHGQSPWYPQASPSASSFSPASSTGRTRDIRGSKMTILRVINLFKEKNISLFRSDDLKKIFKIKSENTLKKLLQRLKKANIIKRLIKNKYLFIPLEETTSDFQIANFLVSPSYISLESALSFYGLIDQFPYRIASITLKKSREFTIHKKLFVYSKIKKEYFKDFLKLDNFLIATKKKALFDYLYFIYKGLRPKSSMADLRNYLKEKEFKDYLLENADLKFLSFVKRHVKL